MALCHPLGTTSSRILNEALSLIGKGDHGVVSLGWQACLLWGQRCSWAGKGASLGLLNTSSFLFFRPYTLKNLRRDPHFPLPGLGSSGRERQSLLWEAH